MKKVNRKWNLISETKRKSCLKEIITFFKEKQDLEIGEIAAEDILDFFMESVSEDIYNKGVNDSKDLLKERFEDFEIDLDLLKSK